jgi:hypothetical protein
VKCHCIDLFPAFGLDTIGMFWHNHSKYFIFTMQFFDSFFCDMNKIVA